MQAESSGFKTILSACQTITNKHGNISQVYPELNLESLARDLDLTDLHSLLDQDSQVMKKMKI